MLKGIVRLDTSRKVDLGDIPTTPPGDGPDEVALEGLLAAEVARIAKLQRKLIAQNQWAVLVILQGMDTSGKDGTIRAALSGVDPAGCQVHSFKAPSAEELDHDFLWRTWSRLPERGRIGVFNRSWYEEVTAVRVEPSWLARQNLPETSDAIWTERLDSIRHAERHLRRNGTVILKVLLHISKGEQRKRLLARIDDPERNWKLDPADLDARDRWKDYRRAYEAAIEETARPEAPWFVVPADHKPWARLAVAQLIRRQLEALDLEWPEATESIKSKLADMRARLAKPDDPQPADPQPEEPALALPPDDGTATPAPRSE